VTDPTPRTAAGTFQAEREPGEALSREEIAGMLSDVVKKLHTRLTAARFKEHTTDPGLLAMARAFTAAIGALDGVLKNQQIDELESRLAALEQQKEREKPQRY